MSSSLAQPIVSRSPVSAGSRYDAYRKELRYDFVWSCAYCSRAEGEVQAVGFEIDHYRPRKAGGTDDYGNLYWACRSCNRDKSAFVSAAPPDHRRLIRVDQEHPAAHLSLAHDAVRIEAVSPVGAFQIEHLRLNAPAHYRVRTARAQLTMADDIIAHGLRTLRNVNFDMLRPEKKPLFVRTMLQLENQHRTLDAALENLLRSVDADPPSRADLRRRQAYLQEQMLPRATPPQPPSSTKKKRKRKR